MQYKIPIHIENEDTIIFGLSLRQLGIIVVWVILAFGVFNKLQGSIPNTPLFVICVIIIGVFFVIAKFNTHEMTFVPFLLNFMRFRINGNGANGQWRVWIRGVDSYSPLEIWYVQSETYDDKKKKHTKDTSKLAEHLKKI